jgi:hypothetical protein
MRQAKSAEITEVFERQAESAGAPKIPATSLTLG